MTQDHLEIHSALQGDVRAYAALVNKYQSMVFVLVRSVCRSAEDAQEVTQDVFLKVYQQLHTFQGNARSGHASGSQTIRPSATSGSQTGEQRCLYQGRDLYRGEADEEPDLNGARYEQLRSLVRPASQERMLIEIVLL